MSVAYRLVYGCILTYFVLNVNNSNYYCFSGFIYFCSKQFFTTFCQKRKKYARHIWSFHCRKRMCLAHSRASRGRVRQSTSLRECASLARSCLLCNREFPDISCCIKKLQIHISTDMDPQSFSIYFYLLFLSLVRKQRCGKVSVAGIRKQCHDRLSCVFRSLRKFDRCPDRRTGGNSHEDSFLLSN